MLTAIAAGLGYVAWATHKSWRPNANQEEKIWRQLAVSQNLNFTAGGDRGDTFVSGRHQGHFLTLRTLQKETGLHTRISLNNRKAFEAEIGGNELNNLVRLTKTRRWRGHIQAEEHGRRIYHEEPGVETDIDYIRRIVNLLHELISIYPNIINLGGSAIPTLQEIGRTSEEFRQVCAQMIKSISQDTTDRLSEHVLALWCPKCMTHFEGLKANLPVRGHLIYYGCRICGQSRESLWLENGVTAILDSQALSEQTQHDRRLRVNWLSRRKMFDFDRVEIVQATDEEVERFAIQVGNDTDDRRRHGYREMVCDVNCELSLNTIKILGSIFGQVRN